MTRFCSARTDSGVSVGDPDLARVAQANPPAEACLKLVAMALERGGPDNITLLLRPLRFRLTHFGAIGFCAISFCAINFGQHLAFHDGLPQLSFLNCLGFFARSLRGRNDS